MTMITPKQALKGLENIIERQSEQIAYQKKEIAELKERIKQYRSLLDDAEIVYNDSNRPKGSRQYS